MYGTVIMKINKVNFAEWLQNLFLEMLQRASMMKLFLKVVNGFQPLTVCTKKLHHILFKVFKNGPSKICGKY